MCLKKLLNVVLYVACFLGGYYCRPVVLFDSKVCCSDMHEDC